MGKHIIFSVLLNVLLIGTAIVGIYAYKNYNLFVMILCASAFGLSVYYKIKHTQVVRQEMKQKAEENVKKKTKKKNNPK
ncbi:MAG: hypothetical protein IE931_00280 [Sphingobacteriales bacterium]|nr:hypothetical protein [Sphingobacteriales bacterium]